METITKQAVPLNSKGNPTSFYPYTDFISSVKAKGKPEGAPKEECIAADLLKFKPATVIKEPVKVAVTLPPVTLPKTAALPQQPARIKKPWER